MPPYKTLSMDNLMELSTVIKHNDDPDYNEYRMVKKELGALETRELKHEIGTILQYKSVVDDNLRIEYNEEQMVENINICFTMQGQVALHFPKYNFQTALADFQHHHIYAPEPRYDLLVNRNVHGFHFTIKRDYYAELLCDLDRTTGKLKESLYRQQMTWSGSHSVNASMRQSLDDIFSTPLQGKLKSMFIEGKVLELIALQLGQSTAIVKSTKRSDADVFHDIKKYLDIHFTDDLSLRGIARTFGLNEFKLKKGFKMQFETTIFDYIHDLRMIHANHLLRDNKMFVNEVSSIVGYKNPNHFSTAFKRRFGISPSSIK
ncbi:helix-turn-helix transcriptional regulator [Pseudochryseolinea flava]|uniref:HTH araC/xylS-type domain-containing protein n=1 Tax=Pseudochryseolinea flava TaxID=2059302 RepID=A0A364Y300_9BACT|nr:AraC family transcriptional regulator [Pseudochryseolinea flava]RAW00692.1 hypothetical protein DQQ10_13990 [Pseudochryseolinea flava]